MKVQDLYLNLKCKLTSAYNVNQYRINMAKIDRAMASYGILNLRAICQIRTKEDIAIRNYDDNSEIKFDKGTRISKILKKLVSLFRSHATKEDVDNLMTAVSSFVADQKNSGVMCLSIHPLDYMTMSDNDCNWSSCMSWVREGGYRQGTVEMMNSPCVIEAYLEKKEPMQIGSDGQWSNKRWRQLFIVTPDIITGVYPYPYNDDNLTKICLDWLKDLRTQCCGFTYRDTTNTMLANGLINAEKGCYFGFNTYMMYNDMSRRCHEVYLANKENIECEITYSGEPECMCCGQNLLDTDLLDCEEATGWLTCNNCCSHPIGTCDCCGAEIYSEDDEFWFDDQVLCQNCYENETVTNLITGDRIWNDDTSLVDIYLDNKKVGYGYVYERNDLEGYDYDIADDDEFKFNLYLDSPAQLTTLYYVRCI